MSENIEDKIGGICGCEHLARVYPCTFLTNHHRDCTFYDPLGDAATLINVLLDGIQEWADYEDGIPDFILEAYDRAAISVGRKPSSKEAKP